MSTVCHEQLSLGTLFGKEITLDFEGGQITSDAGVVLLEEVDRRYGVTEEAAQCLDDPRDPDRVVHETLALVKQRLFSIALGYEDANDADTLRHDPALKTVSGRPPESGEDLASQPTLSRLENRVSEKDLARLSAWLLDLYVKTHPGPRRVIVIDLDATDDPTHGHQQLSLFHGYYEQHMYHPLLALDGESGFPLGVVLRPGNVHASKGVIRLLKRILRTLKKAYPKATMVVRADAGFAVPALYRFCERHRLLYVIGFINNARLERRVAGLLAQAEAEFRRTGVKQRRFTAFWYRADSWRRPRRMLAKVEYHEPGPNQRFVITNLGLEAQPLYDHVYVLRGEMENRIKELKLGLKADRLSCHRFDANQFRLLLHTAAYCLFLLLRRHLAGTELEHAQVQTLRLKLLKIGARVRETSRRIWFHLASGYPYQRLFQTVLRQLQAHPL
jgi:hypothetical protein